MWNDILNWLSKTGSHIGEEILDWLYDSGPTIIAFLAIIIIGWWVSSLFTRMISGAIKRSKADAAMGGFICSCIKFVLKLLVVIAALSSLGVNLTSVVTALGAAGITLGLAMKDTLANFASGVLILFNKPFTKGDYVEVDGSMGTVDSIELMYTTLLTADNKHLVFPNSKMTENKLINYTAEHVRRMDMQFTTAYSCDVERAKGIIREVGAANKYVLADKDISVGIAEFGASGIVFELRVWIEASDYWDAFYQMQESIKCAFDENGITIPFNQLDVHVDSGEKQG